MEAWARLNRVALTPWEADTLMALSTSYKGFVEDEELYSPYENEASTKEEMLAFFAAVKAQSGNG